MTEIDVLDGKIQENFAFSSRVCKLFTTKKIKFYFQASAEEQKLLVWRNFAWMAKNQLSKEKEEKYEKFKTPQ